MKTLEYVGMGVFFIMAVLVISGYWGPFTDNDQPPPPVPFYQQHP
jgi:hypothetical protein